MLEVPAEGITARPAFHPKYGDIWKARCAMCPWTSRGLPIPTEEQAIHIGNLHVVMCKGRARV